LVSSHSFDLNQTGILQSPVEFEFSGLHKILGYEIMLDYGAGTCHMTFPLWCDLGLNKICFEKQKRLLALMGVNSLEEMTFSKLPLRKSKLMTKLGNGFEVPAYEFRLDKLVLGSKIELPNITVRLIDSKNDDTFVIGLNVLRYLSINYKPFVGQSIFQFAFEESGRELLEHDRVQKRQNNMPTTFFYLE